MAEQIIQTLGFDASGAIATINQLNQSLAQLSTQLNAVAGSARAFNQAKLSRSFKTLANANPAQSLNNAATAAGNLGNKLNQVTNQGAQGLNNLNDRTKSLSISWQTLSRIIIAQTIVRGINAITGSIRDSIRETRELQKRIGEIQTIAQGGLGTNADVFEGLQATAEKFGFDILDVAEAKYQELSNQVEGSTESLKFQESAAKLARATNSSLTDSVNLLSSTLNAFGQDATNSEAAAGLLFKTIEQGRIRASELANTLGRVAPIANSLGVDFAEVGAALARITQGGTRADTAITQLLGIMNKLAKPTDALKDAFNELGVATAQQGIQESGGLLRFLTRLQDVAGDNQGLVEFFNNVRAIQGVLALIGTDANKTKDVFQALGLTSSEAAEALNAAFGTATQNDAVTYEQLIQKLNGTFRDLATQVIPLINDALSFFIGLIDKIRDNPVLTGSLLATAAGAFVGVGVAAAGAGVGIGGFAAAVAASAVAIGPAVLIVGALAAAVVLLNKAYTASDVATYTELTERFQKVLDDTNAKIKESSDALDAQRDAFKNGSQEIRNFVQQFQELRKAANDSVNDLNSNFVDDSTALLDNLLKTRQRVTKEIQKAINDADAAITKSSERVANTRAKKEDFLLNRQLKNLNDVQKAFKLFEASQAQAFSAKDLIEGSTDLADFDAAAKVLDRRLDLAQKGLAAANASGNRAAIAKAEQQVVTALNDQINLETRRGQLIEQRKVAAEAAAEQDKQQTQNLKTLVGDIKDELSVLNDQGGLLNDEQLAAQEKKVADLLKQLGDFGLDSEQVDLGEFLGIQDLQNQFQKALDSTQKSIAERRGGIVGEMEQVFAELNKVVDDNVLKIAVELELTQGGPDQLGSLVEASSNASREIDNLIGAQKRFEEANIRSGATFRAFQEILQGTSGPPAFIQAVEAAVRKLADPINATEQDFLNLKKLLEFGIGTDILNRIDLGGPDVEDRKAVEELANQWKRVQDARKKASEVEDQTSGDRSRLQELQDFQDQATKNIQSVQSIIDVLGSARGAAKQIGQAALENINDINQNKTAWGNVETAAKNAEKAVRAYSKAVSEAPPPPSGGGGANSMFGGFRGPLFRAAGGFARGTDTIPAMLSPGEFVVNARSSRRFASQLIAMNAGVNPIYRQDGGPVVNNTVNVGDINVNGTANPDDTARRVVSQLRREFRRGTASRF
jgi:TP901 family phage tail tape measure protein